MGVHVILDIDPRGIDEAEWAAVYEETLALLSAWRPRLLGRGWRTIDGVRVPVYTRSLRGDVDEPKHARWSVAGDRDSLRTAECQSFFRDLGVYAARRDPCPDDDIVVTAAMPDRVGTGGPVRVFGGKTQGCPYHFPGEDGAREWQRALAGSKSSSAPDAIRLVIAWLNAGRGLRDACRLACLAPAGPRFSREDFVAILAWTWVAVPPPAREALAASCTPPGAPHTLASLLGFYFFETMAMGRRLRIPVEPAALAADLSAVFGDRGPALAEQLREKSAKLEAQLRENVDLLKTLAGVERLCRR